MGEELTSKVAESPPESSEILSGPTEAFPYGLFGEFLHLESLL